MKNPRMEKLARLQRQHQRNNPWNLNKDGLWITTCYDERKDDDLSWRDDVGFVLNKRKVIVWRRHPRRFYLDEIRNRAIKLVKLYELEKNYFDELHKIENDLKELQGKSAHKYEAENHNSHKLNQA